MSKYESESTEIIELMHDMAYLFLQDKDLTPEERRAIFIEYDHIKFELERRKDTKYAL